MLLCFYLIRTFKRIHTAFKGLNWHLVFWQQLYSSLRKEHDRFFKVFYIVSKYPIVCQTLLSDSIKDKCWSNAVFGFLFVNVTLSIVIWVLGIIIYLPLKIQKFLSFKVGEVEMPRLLINTSAEPIANFGYTYYGQLGKLLLLQKGHFAKTRLLQPG